MIIDVGLYVIIRRFLQEQCRGRMITPYAKYCMSSFFSTNYLHSSKFNKLLHYSQILTVTRRYISTSGRLYSRVAGRTLCYSIPRNKFNLVLQYPSDRIKRTHIHVHTYTPTNVNIFVLSRINTQCGTSSRLLVRTCHVAKIFNMCRRMRYVNLRYRKSQI